MAHLTTVVHTSLHGLVSLGTTTATKNGALLIGMTSPNIWSIVILTVYDITLSPTGCSVSFGRPVDRVCGECWW